MKINHVNEILKCYDYPKLIMKGKCSAKRRKMWEGRTNMQEKKDNKKMQ